MKTQSKVQILVENIQREIELLNSSSLTHREKRGALGLISLELDEVGFLHESAIDGAKQKYEFYKKQYINKLLAIEGLAETCTSVLKHRTHNRAVQRHLEHIRKLCVSILAEKDENLKKCVEEDIPF